MKCFIYLVMCIFTISLCSSVFATGISGSDLLSKELFVPDSVREFNFYIATSDVDVRAYSVYAKGDTPLVDHVVFDQTRFEDLPPNTNTLFTGRINMPAELERPGWHAVLICAIEDSTGTGNLGGRAAACASLNFMVLREGIHPVLQFSAQNTNENEPVEFTLTINNLGEEDIKSASGRVEVYNREGEIIGTIDIAPQGIKSNSAAKFPAVFSAEGIPPGSYSARAFMNSDGVQKTANTSFRIGTLDIEIKDYTRELEIGGIKRFLTTLESNWNDPLDVYADITIYDGGIGREKTNIKVKTATVKIMPWKTQELEAFVDTTGLEEKLYDIRIDALYADKKSFIDGKLMLVAPPEGEATEPTEESAQKIGIDSTTLTIVLVIAVILLTIVNMFLAFYKKRKER